MTYPIINPIAFSIGDFHLRWYGIMYILGFACAWILGRYRASLPNSGWTKTEMDDLIASSMLGVILGGRLGYVLFYDLNAYIENPIEIISLWNGGMSFHGGLIGVFASLCYFSRKTKKPLLNVLDFTAPLVAPGLFFGRIGNFINGELWGKVTSLPIGVIFPGAGPYPRHPSQLYEALLEGFILFIIIWLYSSKKHKAGSVAGLFALGYSSFRFLIEFVRVPDSQLGYLAFGWLTMGQLLCIPLLIFGLWLFFHKDNIDSHSR